MQATMSPTGVWQCRRRWHQLVYGNAGDDVTNWCMAMQATMAPTGLWQCRRRWHQLVYGNAGDDGTNWCMAMQATMAPTVLWQCRRRWHQLVYGKATLAREKCGTGDCVTNSSRSFICLTYYILRAGLSELCKICTVAMKVYSCIASLFTAVFCANYSFFIHFYWFID